MGIERINYIEYKKVFREAEKISRRKNADYGCAPLTRFGNYGIFVRVTDKLARLENLYKNNGHRKVLDEKIEDTLIDTINYLNYMVLQERGRLIRRNNEYKRSK